MGGICMIEPDIKITDHAKFTESIEALAALPGTLTEAVTDAHAIAAELTAAAGAASGAGGTANAAVSAALAAVAESVRTVPDGLPETAGSLKATVEQLRAFQAGEAATDHAAAEKVIDV
jgi:hypothetical protein